MSGDGSWRDRLPRGRQAVVTVVALLVAAVAFVLLLAPGFLDVLPGVGDDEQASDVDERFLDYCEEVRLQQRPLTEALAAGPEGLLEAQPSFEALQDEAPTDLVDEWSVVVGRVQDLLDALDAAGVEAGDYEADDPPASVTDDQRRAIEAAARRLVAPETVSALDGVQQQARDVCRIPLTQ